MGDFFGYFMQMVLDFFLCAYFYIQGGVYIIYHSSTMGGTSKNIKFHYTHSERANFEFELGNSNLWGLYKHGDMPLENWFE